MRELHIGQRVRTPASGWKVGDECKVQLFSRGRVVGVVCEARGSEWRIANTQSDSWAWSCIRAPSEMRRPGQVEAASLRAANQLASSLDHEITEAEVRNA